MQLWENHDLVESNTGSVSKSPFPVDKSKYSKR